MTRVGVIGANGQVGAEICLMLAQRPGIELVAICRTRSGSAFLRWQGIACRHGRAADSTDAARLIADCDVIVNSSLATGNPAQIRRTEDRIIHNLFACSKNSASIIHFSTQSVYGDPRPERWIRIQNPYGRAKLASERRVRAEQRRSKKTAFILRLGHVCGTMQDISNSLRDSIREGTVVLPSVDCSSNTVYTAAIVGAIMQIIRGAARPGTYDLMNSPPWTWREVYEYEARVCRVEFAPTVAAEAPRRSGLRMLRNSIVRLGGAATSAPALVELGTKLFAYVPERLNARAMAWWLSRRARREIAALADTPSPLDHLSWVANGVNFFPAQTPTRELLNAFAPAATVEDAAGAWPPDLADANANSNAVAVEGGA
jgi:nucleoside-diphosphate-sugar epimerase